MSRFLLTSLFLTIFTGLSWAQGLRIGIVASDLVLPSYKGYTAAEEQLSREMQGWQIERKTWEADMERLQNEIAGRETKFTANKMLTPQGKAKEQALIDSLRFDFNQRLQSQAAKEQERFNQRRAELLASVFEEVNEEIRVMGEEEGYDLIIDASSGSVVYAKDPEDLNDQLLNRLQQK